MDDENKITMPLIGDRFPKMDVKTTHGKKTLPDAYEGKWFVLFSHPGDFTPVCTTEFMGFQKRMDQFRELNADLIGLSIDQVFSHIKWTEWIHEKMDMKIEFPIIADDMGIVGKKLGMIHPGKGSNTVRAVFIVDPKGFLRLILYYPQEIGRNMDEVVRALKALQYSDEHGRATPANWPNNDFLGSKVIIPPAGTEEMAEERRKKEGCFDWWFCTEEM